MLMTNEKTSYLGNKKDSIKTMIENKKTDIDTLLPDNIQYDKFLRSVFNQFNKNPKLIECDKLSIYDSVMTAAEIGLIPSSTTGHCYLIPYKGKCQYQIGYQGLIELAGREGIYSYINAETVYEEDEFEIELGSCPKLIHKPSISERTKIIGYYAIAYLKSRAGKVHPFKYMTNQEVLDRQPRGYKNDLWTKYPTQMGKKTVIKELLKTSFKTNSCYSIMKAIEVENQNYIDDSFPSEKECSETKEKLKEI